MTIDIETSNQQTTSHKNSPDQEGKIKERGQKPKGKRANFVRLAEKRVGKAIASISLIGNLANRGAYEYGEKEVSRILEALRAEVDGVEAQFNAARRRGDKRKFSF